MNKLTQLQRKALINLLTALIDQRNAEIIIPAKRPEAGYWFGGGKLALDQDGSIWLSGRYRNAGDSRTGLEAGVRGMECAIFRSQDRGQTFTKVKSWSKADLSHHPNDVISIEGTALNQREDKDWELFISLEITTPYPVEVSRFQKAGTGVWQIDRLQGTKPDTLDLKSQQPAFKNPGNPQYLHIKDPTVFIHPNGSTILIFCTHPFSWASDNSGYALRKPGDGDFTVRDWEMIGRGPAWDVAVTRITSRLPIPRVGLFSDAPPGSIYLYDGAECMRSHPESKRGYHRPRGYSCEEIGGATFGWDSDFPAMARLSPLEPLFLSPWGTGASRYADCLVTGEGLLAIWQQSQEDGSQPLVRHFLPLDEVERILSGDE